MAGSWWFHPLSTRSTFRLPLLVLWQKVQHWLDGVIHVHAVAAKGHHRHRARGRSLCSADALFRRHGSIAPREVENLAAGAVEWAIDVGVVVTRIHQEVGHDVNGRHQQHIENQQTNGTVRPPEYGDQSSIKPLNIIGVYIYVYIYVYVYMWPIKPMVSLQAANYVYIHIHIIIYQWMSTVYTNAPFRHPFRRPHLGGLQQQQRAFCRQ